MILSCIAVVFALSWLPMTAFTIIFEFHPFLIRPPSTLYLVFALCHVTAMSTAVTNPLMYGWLNTNFRREFRVLGNTGVEKAREARRRLSTAPSVALRHDRRTSVTCFTTMTSSNTRPSTSVTLLPQAAIETI